MTDTKQAVVPFVDPREKEREAYQLGFNEVEKADMVGEDSDKEEPIELIDCPHSSIMPTLRAIAGNSDSGHGTYTVSETVSVETFPNRPKARRYSRIGTGQLVDNVATAYRNGVRDALRGNEKRYEAV